MLIGKHKYNIWFKAITVGVISLLLIGDTAYSLNIVPASQNPDLERRMRRKFEEVAAAKDKSSQAGPEEYIVFVSTTEIGKRSFSMGRGGVVTSPEKPFSLSETLDYLETHPNDRLMISYLNSLVYKIGQEAIDEIIRRFRNNPTSILLGALLNTTHEQYTGIDEAVQEVTEQISVPRLLELWENHPSVDVRAMTNPEFYIGQKELDSIFRQNRDGHKPLGQIGTIRLSIPADLLAAAGQRKYVHVSTLKPSQASQDITTGTGMRAISPEETLARIDKLPLFDLLASDPRGFGFNHSYAVEVPWKLGLKYSSGRNHYIIKGNIGNSGKGLTHESSTASGLMEMLERYSAVAGLTADFPKGYLQDKTMIRARRSEFQAKGLDALDINALNLKIPYQDEELYWVWGEKITSEGASRMLVPAQLVFIETNFDEPEVSIYGRGSNGLASGNTPEEARLHALLELVERDGDYSIFYSPERCFSINAPENSDIGQILAIAEAKGITVQFLDLTTEFGIPTYRAFVKIGEQIISGSGAHLDAKTAITRALCELNPKIYVYTQHNGGLTGLSNELASDRIISYGDLSNYSTGNIKADLSLVEQVLSGSGFTVSYVDLTRRDLNVPVVRAIVPGLDIPDGVGERQILHLVQELKRLGILGIEKPAGSPQNVFSSLKPQKNGLSLETISAMPDINRSPATIEKDLRELRKLGLATKSGRAENALYQAVDLDDTLAVEMQGILTEEYKVLSKADFNKAHARVVVAKLLHDIRAQAKACKEKDEELAIAIDTDIGNLRDIAPELMEVLKEVRAALAKEGLDNVRVFINEGIVLSAELKSYMDQAEVEHRKVMLNAIVKNRNLQRRIYTQIGNKACMTSIDDASVSNTDVSNLNYIPILSILDIAIKRSSGVSLDKIKDEYASLQNVKDIIERDSILTIILLPKPVPIPLNELRERYKLEAQTLSAA